MDKCPVCGADTRQGDNYCLNCGQRLFPSTPSSSPVGDPTIVAADEWNGVSGSSPSGWPIDSGGQVVAASEASTQRESVAAPTAQAILDKFEQPARFILRSDTGEVLQEYPLDKPEIVIGRAPNSDILLSKDKLTSRRHANVHYENGRYLLLDEHSANGTFVNGEQIEEAVPYVLHDGDHVGIGEHELVFRAYGSPASAVEDLPTVAVSYEPPQEVTYRTRDDALATIPSSDEFGTLPGEENEVQALVSQSESSEGARQPVSPPLTPVPEPEPVVSEPEPVASAAVANAEKPAAALPPISADPAKVDTNITFNRFASLSQPALPDMGAFMAALSTLDGQVMALQEQFNTTQEAMRNHDAEVAQTANQLRTGIHRVAERMDNTIADVARSREALAWAELLQLMEDVMTNPRDIEYVTKLARKARELNKVFQLHQNVLNTMAECNSLLRSMIGDDKY
ncbi:MAG TPA: FHA domain-containing protein [Ktedonobacteraceae bacterium]|jgi:predicted component of type VI protein secretion system